MKLGWVTAGIIVLFGPCLWAAPVHFEDANLKAAVESALGLKDPTENQMLGLLELSCIHGGLVDLTGLETALNLRSLNIRHNSVGDLSPVSGLTQLTTLIINNNLIFNLDMIGGLWQLTHLDVHDCRVSDITPLSGMAQLETLVIYSNSISDLSPLSSLIHLVTLDLHDNDVSNIKPLSELRQLRRLDLKRNPLNHQACSIDIPNLYVSNPGISISHNCLPLELNLSSSIGGRIIPRAGRYTYSYGDVVTLVAVPKSGFVFKRFTGTTFHTQSPYPLYMNQDHTIMVLFESLRDTIIVDGNAPNDPGPNDPGRSDPAEDGSPEHPIDSIQEAIEVAADGATILVRPGIYHEHIQLMGKRIHLLGIDPNDPNQRELPVIQGVDSWPVVSCLDREDPNCLIEGFVVAGGHGSEASAVLCSNSSPMISHCLIIGNRSENDDSVTVSCVKSQATFVNCTIADNVAGAARGVFSLENSHVRVRNAIFWNNSPQSFYLDDKSQLSMSYTCVETEIAGAGNIQEDPNFAQPGYWSDADENWVLGDYHLVSKVGRWCSESESWVQDSTFSPCIDAGDPNDSVDLEAEPNGDRINLGAYGGTLLTSQSPLNP